MNRPRKLTMRPNPSGDGQSTITAPPGQQLAAQYWDGATQQQTRLARVAGMGNEIGPPTLNPPPDIAARGGMGTVRREWPYTGFPLSATTIYTMANGADEIPAWGTAPRARDVMLRNFWPTEPFLASTVYAVAGRYTGLTWTIDGPDDIADQVTTMLNGVEHGKGWSRWLFPYVIDMLTQDNGGWAEIIRAEDDPLSPVVSLSHLDSVRCVRTGRWDEPIIYIDIRGIHHRMKWYQCMELVEMPSPNENARGLQYCLHPDATVRMANGATRRIIELVRERCTDEVMSLCGDGDMRPAKITGWHENQRNGRRWVNLRGALTQFTRGNKYRNSWLTEDHPVLTTEGWKPAGELNTGDAIVTEAPAPNPRQMAVIIGSLLGDGSLPAHGNRARMTIGHIPRNEDWLHCKTRALYFLDWHYRQNALQTKAESKAQACLVELRDAFYRTGHKSIPFEYLDGYVCPELLATWYLDDGSIRNREWTSRNRSAIAVIGAQGSEPEDVVNAATILTASGYECNAARGDTKGGMVLCFTVNGSKRFFKDIARFVPPSMRYKLPLWPEIVEYDPDAWDLGRAEQFVDVALVSSDHAPNVQTVYCIDVEDSHNFVTAGLIVHNCALTRTLRACQIARDYGIYTHEKVSGRFNKQIHLVSGIQSKVISTALRDHANAASEQNLARYIQPAVIASLDPNAKVTATTLNLAGLPDGFDQKESMVWYITNLALGFGGDYQDLAPLQSRGGMGSAQGAEILQLKSRGKGVALFMNNMEQNMNYHGIMPKLAKFNYSEADNVEALEEIELDTEFAKKQQVQIMSGLISTQAARNEAIAKGYIDEDWLTDDEPVEAPGAFPGGPMKQPDGTTVQPESKPIKDSVSPGKSNPVRKIRTARGQGGKNK
jgi:hypothetical protein